MPPRRFLRQCSFCHLIVARRKDCLLAGITVCDGFARSPRKTSDRYARAAGRRRRFTPDRGAARRFRGLDAPWRLGPHIRASRPPWRAIPDSNLLARSRDGRSIVFLHGGGLVAGSLETQTPVQDPCGRKRLCGLRCGLSAGTENPFPCCARGRGGSAAMDIRQRAKVRYSRIGIGGDSAGATLAAVTAAQWNARRRESSPFSSCCARSSTLPGKRHRAMLSSHRFSISRHSTMICALYSGPSPCFAPSRLTAPRNGIRASAADLSAHGAMRSAARRGRGLRGKGESGRRRCASHLTCRDATSLLRAGRRHFLCEEGGAGDRVELAAWLAHS